MIKNSKKFFKECEQFILNVVDEVEDKSDEETEEEEKP